MQNKNKLHRYLIAFCFCSSYLPFSGCKKFVDAGAPQSQTNTANVYSQDATATAVLTGIYSYIAQGQQSPDFSAGIESISLRAGMSADEFKLIYPTTIFNAFYQNALVSNPTTQIGTDYWTGFYNYLYTINSAIEGISGSASLSTTVKNQLLGEAKFLRGFFYFYLTNLYGDVPLITSTDYKVNSLLSRTAANSVYQQITQDLKDAEDLLSTDYLNANLQKYSGSAERVRPTKWAAAALLARVYLYTKDYTDAETEATKVIGNASLYDINVPLNSVFLKNSKEAIWQLQPVKLGVNTDDSQMFIITTGPSSNNPVKLSDTLLNSFEAGDNRKINGNWINSVTLSGITYYFPYKYKNNTAAVTEYLMVLRLAEQYLIRAEARAQLGNTGGAQTDLNAVRTRAGLSGTGANTQATLLTAILHERQTELFSEWGHRWFDLKRTGTINAVMAAITPIKGGGTWQSSAQLYPISYNDLLSDKNLTQNAGY